ncbi:hypothetical protein ACIQU6_41430 [Streptomyces sp. NPDC090442]|uniref:hypothetical protein n=1 Tax=Streptomyces sp. NPDC090442 TaxID=3365962 RepID=UPI0037F5D983
MRIENLLRIIGAATLNSLADANDRAERYNAEADRWCQAYCFEAQLANTAEETVDELRTQVDELRVLLDEIAAELEGAYAVHRQAYRERDEARAELTAVRDELLTAAKDPAGSEFRGRLALVVLPHLLDELTAAAPATTTPAAVLASLLLDCPPEEPPATPRKEDASAATPQPGTGHPQGD